MGNASSGTSKGTNTSTTTRTRGASDNGNVAAIANNRDGSRSQSFTYDELLQRDKVSLDISWLRDESLEDTDDLPPPETGDRKKRPDRRADHQRDDARGEADAQ